MKNLFGGSACFRRWSRPRAQWAITALLCAVLTAPAGAGEARNLADLTLEQLMNESITSVSKREQRLVDAAAAVAVVTNDDLRRSGATTLPDALRMVPGIEVAAVNAGQWAITSRGFNDGFANKLLVLVDGRAVYTPLFSGVHWDLQHTVLEDVDQIEVIRGPGATLWGANAVNGVINVVTRSAKDTQGGLVYGGAGSVHEALGGVRYGGRIGANTYYRVFGTYQEQEANVTASGAPARDAWHTAHGGVRVDREVRPGVQLMWQAGATGTNFDSGASRSLNVNTLGQWTRTWAPDHSFQVQAYLDRTREAESNRSWQRIDTVDVTTQHNFHAGGSHGIVWGLGYRGMETRVRQTNPTVVVRHSRFRHALASGFVQDELVLLPDRLTLTGGIKLEHNDFTGVEIQPSVRGVFKPTPSQTLWAAISRAVRTPSELEYEKVFSIAVGPPFPGPGGGLYFPRLVGNPNLRSEVMWAYQAGYRIQPSPKFSMDLAAFYNAYARLAKRGNIQRFVPGAPFGTAEVAFENMLEGETLGGEIVFSLAVTDAWRLIASYSGLALHVGDVTSPGAPVFETGSPKHQVKLRSSFDFAKRASVDAQFRYVSELMTAPSYLEADLRLSYRPDDATEISVVGQNLLDGQHVEHGPGPVTVFTETRRGIHVKISRRF